MEFLSSLTLSKNDQIIFLEKRIELLKKIEEVGSISKAAALVPMSYKSAWDAIDAINNLCSKPVVIKETGGTGGGGAKITPYGKNFIQTYSLLQKEHEKFLSQITKITDFNTGILKSIQRLNMQISARNQIQGIVEFLQKDRINASVGVKLKSGKTIVSVITNDATDSLGLKIGDDVVAIFKSSNVLVTTQDSLKISARNAINGVVDKIIKGNINSELIIDIGNNEKITSIITTNAITELNINLGDTITAIIKSSDVMIGI